jgi:hypothetical protein
MSKKRFAVQSLTDLAEFGRTNSISILVDPMEGEGKLMLSEGGQLLKIDLHSLSNDKFRKNAVFKLEQIREAINQALGYFEIMLEPVQGPYPAVNPEKSITDPDFKQPSHE